MPNPIPWFLRQYGVEFADALTKSLCSVCRKGLSANARVYIDRIEADLVEHLWDELKRPNLSREDVALRGMKRVVETFFTALAIREEAERYGHNFPFDAESEQEPINRPILVWESTTHPPELIGVLAAYDDEGPLRLKKVEQGIAFYESASGEEMALRFNPVPRGLRLSDEV